MDMLSTFKSAFHIANTLQNRELINNLSELQKEIMETRNEMMALQDENRHLKEALEFRDSIELVPGMGYYKNKITGEVLCPTCQSEGKQVYMHDAFGAYSCWVCKTAVKG